jgi:hypothetical protein
VRRLRKKSRPLHWLTYPPRQQRWLLTGWESLNVAAVLGDSAAIQSSSHDYAAQITFDWARYSRRIRFLTRDDASVAADLGYDWSEFSQYVHRGLMRAMRQENFEVPVGGKPLARWVEETLDSFYVSPKAALEKLRDPGELFRFGYECLSTRKNVSTVWSEQTLQGLILMGIASSGVLDLRRCQFCYRWAESSQVFCSEHSQAKKYSKSDAVKTRNYFIGRRTAESLDWLESPPKLTVYSDVARSAILMAHSLWDVPPNLNGSDIVFDEIRTVLITAKNVRRRLNYSKALSNTALEVSLRKELDPLELWVAAWPEKIQIAEIWFCAEKAATSGRRGLSAKTTDRIARAEKLAKTGKNITDICQALGISRSAIVKWCARGRAPSLSAILSEVRSSCALGEQTYS